LAAIDDHQPLRRSRQFRDESIVTVFAPSEAKPPPEIADFAAAMQRVLDKGPGDLLAPEAIKAYFEEVYWQRGKGLDKHDIAGKFLIGAGESNFAYRSIADRFRMIESGMVPVIVAIEQEAEDIVDGLKPGASAAEAARRLQRYIAQVPPRARNAMIASRDVQYVAHFGDQFAILKNDALYTPEQGLVWEASSGARFEFWEV
jgi:CRISPR-associated endonuclease/helicase Cas3